MNNEEITLDTGVIRGVLSKFATRVQNVSKFQNLASPILLHVFYKKLSKRDRSKSFLKFTIFSVFRSKSFL